MYNIAIKMLVRSKAKFYAMIFAIASCSMMMAQQPAIFMGIMVRSYSVIADIPQIDIWVVKTGVKTLDTATPIRYNDLFVIKSMPYVEWAVPFYKGVQRAMLDNGEFVSVDVVGVDDVSLIGIPEAIVEGKKEDLKKSDAIFLDTWISPTKLFKLGANGYKQSLEIGDFIELNEKRKTVAGYVKASPNVLSQPVIFTTYSSALRSAIYERNSLTAILVKVKQGIDPEEVVNFINKSAYFKAYTRQQFANSTFNDFIKNSSIMESFGIGLGFVFIVSVIIIGAIFYSFIVDNIRSLAVLKAMGLNDKAIARMTILQLTIGGLVGFCIGIGIASIFGILVGGDKVGYKLMPQMILFSGISIAIICLVSAYIGLKKIRETEPAIVFKGN